MISYVTSLVFFIISNKLNEREGTEESEALLQFNHPTLLLIPYKAVFLLSFIFFPMWGLCPNPSMVPSTLYLFHFLFTPKKKKKFLFSFNQNFYSSESICETQLMFLR